jgi:hypothetical protein
MNWLICVVLGHNWKYRCDMDHGTLTNTRKCLTCGKQQIGKYVHDDFNATWRNKNE